MIKTVMLLFRREVPELEKISVVKNKGFYSSYKHTVNKYSLPFNFGVH